jgi:hypothetical protein
MLILSIEKTGYTYCYKVLDNGLTFTGWIHCYSENVEDIYDRIKANVEVQYREQNRSIELLRALNEYGKGQEQ